MRLVFVMVKDKLDKQFGCFELFGFDFMIDENLNPYLIEINTNPALFTDTSAQKDMLPKLVEDVVKMTLDIHQFGKKEGTEEVLTLINSGLKETQLSYEIIYSDI